MLRRKKLYNLLSPIHTGVQVEVDKVDGDKLSTSSSTPDCGQDIMKWHARSMLHVVEEHMV